MNITCLRKNTLTFMKNKLLFTTEKVPDVLSLVEALGARI